MNKILQMQGISKSFGGVHALVDVHLDVERGEIHALLGENGAGKSTLMNVLTGVISMDKGDIEFDGKTYWIQFEGFEILRGFYSPNDGHTDRSYFELEFPWF